MDYRKLQGDFGYGSSTMYFWIQNNLLKDAMNRFPVHWGAPPVGQTKDIRELPGGYGYGSTTMFKWIEEQMKADESYFFGSRELWTSKVYLNQMVFGEPFI